MVDAARLRTFGSGVGAIGACSRGQRQAGPVGLKSERMCVPKAFRGGNKVLLACDERSEQIEMGNAQNEGTIAFHSSSVRHPLSATAAVAAGLPRNWHRLVVGTHWPMDVGSEPRRVDAASI